MAARTTTTTRRTTAPKPRKPKVDFDLDAALAEELEEDDSEAPTEVMSFFGQTFTIKKRVNEYLLSGAASGDSGALHQFFRSIMPADDYVRFDRAMAAHPNMDSDRFVKIFTKMLERVAERPTN